jgi:hypothetical protein
LELLWFFTQRWFFTERKGAIHVGQLAVSAALP